MIKSQLKIATVWQYPKSRTMAEVYSFGGRFWVIDDGTLTVRSPINNCNLFLLYWHNKWHPLVQGLFQENHPFSQNIYDLSRKSELHQTRPGKTAQGNEEAWVGGLCKALIFPNQHWPILHTCLSCRIHFFAFLSAPGLLSIGIVCVSVN